MIKRQTVGWIFLLFAATNARAQSEIRLTLSRAVYLSEAENPNTTFGSNVYFPNINKIPFFKDKNLRRRIQNLDKKDVKNYRLLDTLLTKYVTSFGLQNFKQNVELDMVWKLGQVKEILKDTSRALFYYTIALNNQSRHAKKIQIHYDALRSVKNNDFVDLEYYYRLLTARNTIDTLKPPAGVLLRMTDSINTVFPEYAPYMHPSGKVLIFTSRRTDQVPVTDIDYDQPEDLYYVEIDHEVGGWGNVKPFPDEINTRFNEGSACLSADGSRLYFVRCNAPDGVGVCDIYQADYDRGEWTNIQNLGKNINSASWDSHPCLSIDGKTLYFASNRTGGFGRTDLYRSQQQGDSTWGPAENLGPVVNTIEDEVSPFIHPINNTLYFSSMGHLHNIGGFDIYKSRIINEPKLVFEEPRNVGPLVNTSRDEYYFSIDKDADTLFYSGSAPDNAKNFDLFSFPMPMGARPDAVVSLSGYLIDSLTGKPLTGIVVAIDLDKNVEIEPLYITRTGFFEFRLINQRRYQLMVLGEQAIRITEHETEDSLFSVFDHSVEMNQPFIFELMEFNPNSSELTLGMEIQLDALAEYLNAHPKRKLTIRGNTDSDGDPDYNLALSRERAENIKQYLLQSTSLPDTMILAEGYGSGRPIYPNNSPENKARNRRVEFEILLSPEEEAREQAAEKKEKPEFDLGGEEDAHGSGSGRDLLPDPTEIDETHAPAPTEPAAPGGGDDEEPADGDEEEIEPEDP